MIPVMLAFLTGCAGVEPAPTRDAPSARAEASVDMADGVEVSEGRVRATPPGAPTTAAFFTLRAGGAGATLSAARSPVAETVELHDHVMADGVARMRPIPSVEVPPNGTVSLAPGGKHVMLIGLAGPLEAGSEVPLTLAFADGSETTLTLPVRDAAASGHAGSAHAAHGHGAGKGHAGKADGACACGKAAGSCDHHGGGGGHAGSAKADGDAATCACGMPAGACTCGGHGGGGAGHDAP